jgi:hypothetical protein
MTTQTAASNTTRVAQPRYRYIPARSRARWYVWMVPHRFVGWLHGLTMAQVYRWGPRNEFIGWEYDTHE